MLIAVPCTLHGNHEADTLVDLVSLLPIVPSGTLPITAVHDTIPRGIS
jgi:hypothetical protein